MWTTLNANNAIEGVAITIRFSEALNTMVLKRVMSALESIASAEGFIDRQPIQGFSFDISQDSSGGLRQGVVSGLVLNHMSVERNHIGEAAPTLIRQMFVQPEQIVFQIVKYRGWELELPAAIKMLAPALKLAAGVVAIQAIRLEYLNRFLFDGPPEDAKAQEILNPSELISQQGFDAPDLWHSHMGRFDEITETSRRLIQVNADFQTMNPPHPKAGLRTLALMLAAERRFEFPGNEMDADNAANVLTEHLSCLHDGIHALFRKLIDSKFAKAHGLPQ